MAHLKQNIGVVGIKFIDEQKYKNNCGVYKITQISKNRIYVGMTSERFVRRFWHHRWKLNDGSHDNKFLQNAWDKYGGNDFIFEVVHIMDNCKNESYFYKMEEYYIGKLDAFNNGFNLTTGGEGKKGTPTPEHVKRIVGEKNRQHNLGKKATEETKAKMRASSPRRKLTEDGVERLRQSRIGTTHSDETKEIMREKKLGSKNKVSKINEDIAYNIKKRLMNGEKNRDIANDLGINEEIVGSIKTNKVWRHVEIEGWEEYIEEFKQNKTGVKKLTDEQVREIRSYLNKGYKANKISKMFNVKDNVIYDIKSGRRYKNVI